MISSKLFHSTTTKLPTCISRFFTMKAWNVASNSQELVQTEVKVPTLTSPNEVLVKVHSASINPLDQKMRYGYGRHVLDILNFTTNSTIDITNDRYPLILGRDFSGVVVSAGPNVTSYEPGDSVYGSVEPQRPGSQAEFVTIPSYCLAHKPKNLTHAQAASIPFVALTAWSALCTFGRLSPSDCSRKSVLVIGGSGGVGTLAIQLLKFWCANVTATCSGKKVDWLLNSLFVDQAVSHDDVAQLESLKGRFDFVLDCGAYGRLPKTHEQTVKNCLLYLKPYKNSTYVTLSPPLLKNTDELGLTLGTTKSVISAATETLAGLKNLNNVRWAFYLPNKYALDYITSMLAQDSLRPFVWKEFPSDLIPKAYEELSSGDVRGKVVANIS